MDNMSYTKKKVFLNKMNDLLVKEELFWHQKSIELWLKGGEKNTKFFHNSTKMWREINRITYNKFGDGRLLEKIEDIKGVIVEYFQNILNEWEGSQLEDQHTFI